MAEEERGKDLVFERGFTVGAQASVTKTTQLATVSIVTKAGLNINF